MPRRIFPLSGSNSPRISLSKVVLPAPLGPIKPTLSPRRIVPVKSRMTVFAPNDFDASVSSATIFPLDWPEATSIFTLPCTSRRAVRLSRNASSRLMRLWLRVRRASTPLRIQISSCASNLSALALMTASCASCSSFCRRYCSKLPGYELSLPRSNSMIRVATRFRKLRSCVMVTTLPLKSINSCSSHSIESRSR